MEKTESTAAVDAPKRGLSSERLAQHMRLASLTTQPLIIHDCQAP